MNKYDGQYTYHRDNIPLMEGEEVIWKGKPRKGAFITGQASQGLAITILWLCFDTIFIIAMISSGQSIDSYILFLIPFFAFHLMPVWIWIKNTITAGKRWENTLYCVTDKRILISDGFFAQNYHTIYYKDIRGVNLHIGFQDKLFKTGDVIFDMDMPVDKKKAIRGGFFDIDDYEKVYKIVQKTIVDIQTDMEYPNAYRPDINPGYGTKYDLWRD